MSTLSSAINLFPPLDNPELTIRRRSRTDPTLLNNSEMAAEGPGGLPNSCQFHGLPGDDANKHLDKFLHVTQSIKVNGVIDDALRLYLFPYSLTHHATAWFDHLPRNSINTFEQMAKMFLGKYFPPSMVTKLRNEITNFRQRPDESLFEAWECYKISIDRCPNHNMLPVTQIDTFYNGLTLRHRDTVNAAACGTFMKRRPEECYDLIENMTAHHNDWDTSGQQSESSSSITFSFDMEIAALKAEMAEINKNLMRVLQVNQQVKAVTPNFETCGGPHSFNDCPATVGNTQNVYAAGAYQGNHNPQGNNQGRNHFFQGANQGQNQPPAYQAPGYQASIHQPQIPQPQVVTTNKFTNFMKANDAILRNMQTNMTSLTNSNLELKNMFESETEATKDTVHPTNNGSIKDVQPPFMKMNTALSSGLGTLPERETEATKDTVHPTNNGSIEDVQPPVVQTKSLIFNSEPVISPIIEPVASPVSTVKPNQRPSISYPFRFHDQKLRDKANDQREKFFQIFKDLNFNISFADALILMPKFGPSIKSLLTNKNKLVDAFLALEDDPTSPEVDQSYVDTEGDILLLEAFLNDDPSLPPTNQGNYLPQVRKELKIFKAKTDKSSIDEPPEVELKDLPPHLKYGFLKDLSVEEKTTLITVLKSHKRAIAWKLSNIKGINPEFCTHKILIEEDFKPTVQHQRRVNPKIHDVINNEVLKLLDVGLIYPISDSPW
nr:reverse transcriptase domain-containing protein [Tanacetum cinerariifolium]